MFKMIVLYSIVSALFIHGSSAKVAPSYIKTCPGLKSDCLKKTIEDTLPHFAKGIPELGIAPIDPLAEDHVKLILPGGFKVELHNGTMTGLRKCDIESVSYANNEANMLMHCNLTIKGVYKASGRILIVSINGDGDAKIKIKKLKLVAKIKFQDKERDGVIYHEAKDLKIEHEYGDKVIFSLTNLFQGNPELSEAVLQFLNQNWKQIAEEFGQPLVDRLVSIVSKIITKFFTVVPKDELFVD
ncbi:circadian clock-controlled protein-like [Trichoplusia ni]|uniref:Circadian clock-controlled protein-like n=1 Tax=Trichoplusia ni TaxID=7111 RepID=A0A7E5W0P6_TRINI|nr:circadian clock-controlled protein-like [Trichoplusia ni]